MASEVLLVTRIAAYWAILALAAWWLAGALYLLVLALAASRYRPHARPEPSTERCIGLLIPAHNEELVLGPVLESHADLDYPEALRPIFVIADNCTDGTATVAASKRAEVLERSDPQLRGKGYALAWALERLLAERPDIAAFVILDADSVLSRNFLRVMNAELDRGSLVVQARYDVLNAEESWRTRMMACALALAHHVRPLGRMVLGLSDGLKGNGMLFARSVLQRHRWSGTSITEDIEYTLRLVRDGIRIIYVPDAQVSAQMPTTARQASTQRQRWEGGRYALARAGIPLLLRSLRRGDFRAADRAMELLIPPFAELLALPTVFLAAAAVWSLFAPPSAGFLAVAAAWMAVLVVAGLYLAVGLAVARVPWRVASSLAFGPIYVPWKLGLLLAMALRGGAGGWKRTERRALSGPGEER